MYKKYIHIMCVALISITNAHCQLHKNKSDLPDLQTRKNILQDTINVVMAQTDYCETHALNLDDIAKKTHGLTSTQLNTIIILSLAAAKKLQHASITHEHILWALYSLIMKSKNESVLAKIVNTDFLLRHSDILLKLFLTAQEMQQSIVNHAPQILISTAKVVTGICSSTIAYHLVCAMPLITLGYCVFDTIREHHFSVDKNIFYSMEYQLFQRIAEEEQTVLQQNIRALDQQINQMKKRIEERQSRQTSLNKLLASNNLALEENDAAVAKILEESKTMSLETILRIARECNAHKQ